MIRYDQLDRLRALQGSTPFADRILAELNYAAALSETLDHKHDGIINDALEHLYRKVEEEGGVITKSAALESESILLPMRQDAKSLCVHCVAHAHIDMNWEWGYQETASLTIDTFRTILDLMHDYENFTFAQSQAATYEMVEKFAPFMLEEIKARIKEGRWEVTASAWVETDKNLPCGESLARHILYTKRYLSRLLDLSPDSLLIDFEPDTFGHNLSVPAICQSGGVKYYYHCRGNSRPAHLYRWQGKEGSELIVYRDPHWYTSTIDYDLFRDVPLLCKQSGIPHHLTVYGVGDHGGGPTRRDVERLIQMSSFPIMPEIRFATFRSFFEEVEKQKEKLPVIKGELNYVFNGCYTSQSRIKMANRIAEARAFESESLCAQASMAGADSFADSFKNAWKHILFSQFHDILPGSGVLESREYAMGQFQESMAHIGINGNTAMRYIASMINTEKSGLSVDSESVSEGGGVGFGISSHNYYRMPSTERGSGKVRLFHLFNPTQYDYCGLTEILVYDLDRKGARAVFTTDEGTPVEYQLLESGKGYWDHSYERYALHLTVPAFGYLTCKMTLEEVHSADSYTLPYYRNDLHAGNSESEIVLENDLLRCTFDKQNGCLLSLTDKQKGLPLISRPSALFRLITEHTDRGMTSWRMGEYKSVKDLHQSKELIVYGISKGELRQSFSYKMPYGDRSSLGVTVRLDKSSPILEYEVTLDHHELGNAKKGIPQVNFALPFSYSAKSCKYDVPFATVLRQPMDYDVPASCFALPMPEEGSGLMLLSDCKHGFRFTDGQIALSLIRSSYDPDPYPEYGVHKMRIGIALCPDTNCDSALYSTVDRFVHPLSYCASDRHPHGGPLAQNGCFVKPEGKIRITALKSAEEDDGVILRFFNTQEESAPFSFTFDKEIKAAFYTDLNEKEICKISFDEKKASDLCPPYGIKTVKILFK